MTPQQQIISNLSDSIATNLLKNAEKKLKGKVVGDGKKLVFFDPISMMIISTIINVAIQILIPIIQKKCKERAENIKNGSAKPGIFTRWLAARAIKQAQAKSERNLSDYGITTKEAYTEIFSRIKDFDTNTIHYVVYEE